MALKKSQLYASLWQSCDELRGGMDASLYKDYVLTLLFMKYVSDKYAGKPDALILVPEGGGFADMVALKGSKDIGESIDKIISRLAEANDLKNVIDLASFNDEEKLGKGKEMVDRLSKLVAIFDGLDAEMAPRLPTSPDKSPDKSPDRFPLGCWRPFSSAKRRQEAAGKSNRPPGSAIEKPSSATTWISCSPRDTWNGPFRTSRAAAYRSTA